MTNITDDVKKEIQHWQGEHDVVLSLRAYRALVKLLQRQRERQAVAVPDGMMLVPIEPTAAMCQAGQDKAREWPKFPLRINPIYQAMLSAAPPADTVNKEKKL